MFTDSARAAIHAAAEEASRRRHAQVDAPHLLLGLLRDDRSGAASLLDELGVDRLDLRRRAESLLPEGSQTGTPDPDPPRSRSANKAIELAMAQAHFEIRSRRDFRVRTEHLLIGLAREKGSVAGVLKDLGLNLERLEESAGNVHQES